MSKILSATYVDYFSDPRAYKIDEGLAISHEVTVLSPRSSKISESKAKIIHCPKSSHNTIINLLIFWFYFIKEALQGDYKIIIAHNYYLTMPLFIIGLFSNSKTVYDSYELYVPTKKRPLSKREHLFYIMEQLTIRKFSLILSANEERSRLMVAKFKLCRRPLSLLNITTSLIKDVGIDIFTKYPEINKIKSKTIFVYQGFLGAGRNCSDFIEIVDKLGKEYALLMVGSGPQLENLKSLSSTLSIKERIVFTGNVPMVDVQPLLKICHYGFISYPFSDLNNKYCSPNKIFEYPAAGLPMISSKQVTIMNIVEKYNIACFVDYNNIEESVDIIKNFIRLSKSVDLNKNIKRFLIENTWAKEFSKLDEAIKQL